MLRLLSRSDDTETDSEEGDSPAEEHEPDDTAPLGTVTYSVSDAGESLRHTIPKLAVEKIGFEATAVDIEIYEDRYVVTPHQGE